MELISYRANSTKSNFSIAYSHIGIRYNLCQTRLFYVLEFFAYVKYSYIAFPEIPDKMCLLTVWNNQWNGIKWSEFGLRELYLLYYTKQGRYTEAIYSQILSILIWNEHVSFVWLWPFRNARFGDAWNKIKIILFVYSPHTSEPT